MLPHERQTTSAMHSSQCRLPLLREAATNPTRAALLLGASRSGAEQSSNGAVYAEDQRAAEGAIAMIPAPRLDRTAARSCRREACLSQ